MLSFYSVQTSLLSSFENVPSVEYKRLEDERTEDPNDSLEDLTVSLSDTKPSSDDTIAAVTAIAGEEDLVGRENLFQYIDEDPFTSLSGKTDQDKVSYITVTSHWCFSSSPRTEWWWWWWRCLSRMCRCWPPAQRTSWQQL